MDAMTRVKVNDQERDLLLLIQRIGYGEIFNIEIPDSEPTCEIDIGSSAKKLLDFIRDGNQSISRLQIHQNEPQYAETNGELFGFRFRKRSKFVQG